MLIMNHDFEQYVDGKTLKKKMPINQHILNCIAGCTCDVDKMRCTHETRPDTSGLISSTYARCMFFFQEVVSSQKKWNKQKQNHYLGGYKSCYEHESIPNKKYFRVPNKCILIDI